MSESEHSTDVCPECKHRNGDCTEKTLYRCPHCERWFCEKHIEPRLAVIRDLKKTIKDPAWRRKVEQDWKRKDGHPDYVYTSIKLRELKIEEEETRSKIIAFLDSSRAYRKSASNEMLSKGTESARFQVFGRHECQVSCTNRSFFRKS